MAPIKSPPAWNVVSDFQSPNGIGSWVGSDIFPTLDPFAQIIKGKSSHSVENVKERTSHSVKGKEKAVMTDSGDDTDGKWGEDISYK